jgi:DNA-binding NtrC family response regulator
MELEAVMGGLAVKVFSVAECGEAWDLITQHHPSLVFVDLNTWRQSHSAIVDMAVEAEQTFNIIVVGALPDIEKYVAAIEHGAFNFIAPPFSPEVLSLVVQTAAQDASARRKSLSAAQQTVR